MTEALWLECDYLAANLPKAADSVPKVGTDIEAKISRGQEGTVEFPKRFGLSGFAAFAGQPPQ